MRSGYDDDDGEDHLPYSYIFKPPKPSDDFAVALRVQLYASPNKKDPEKK